METTKHQPSVLDMLKPCSRDNTSTRPNNSGRILQHEKPTELEKGAIEQSLRDLLTEPNAFTDADDLVSSEEDSRLLLITKDASKIAR